VTVLVVGAFVVTAIGLTFVTYTGIQGRNQALDTVSERAAALKLYEDIRSSGFVESAAATSYLANPQDEFLQRFERSQARVESAIAELREFVPDDEAATHRRIDELDALHTDLAGQYEAILAAVQSGDDEAAIELADDGNVAATASELWTALDAGTFEARTEATLAQQNHASVQRSLDRLVLATVILWTVLLAGAGMAMYRWVARPVRLVAAAAGRIADGDVDVRSAISGPSEIAGLAEDVNSMADSLIERSEELNAYLAKDLEARTEELAKANVALERSEQRFRSLVQHAPDLITVIDADERVVYQSPSIMRVLGYEVEELVGMPLSSFVHQKDQAALSSFLRTQAHEPDEIMNVEVRVRHQNGEWRHLEIFGSDQRDDTVAGIVLNSRDVTDRRSLEEQLRHQAFHDSLTGLANRASFTDRLEHALLRARRSPKMPAVLFLDLDNFKAINDSLGHSAGDEILSSVGGRIQGCLRVADTVARLGGDEFAVLLEDVDTVEGAKVVAERILQAHETPFSIQGEKVFVKASIGVAMAEELTDDERADTQRILRNADVAMYAAKRDGKAYCHVYDEEMHVSLVRHLELLSDMRAAIERKDFFVQYQPLVDLNTREVRGLEALVRWKHPRHGLISPADFIPIAEESGAIRALGKWVLEESCRQMTQWDRSLAGSQELYMSVNVSVQQILDPEFVDEVRETLRTSGFDPARLTLEITESITMYPGDSTIRVLKDLKEIGARLAIDDFGTGSSSYAYLQHFPFDVVKIDKSFVQHEVGVRNARELTRKVIEMGKVLNLEVVAEGIEEEAQLAELRELGCEIGQGYLFAKPMDADDVPRLLAGIPPAMAA